jgi:hypothetical protein
MQAFMHACTYESPATTCLLATHACTSIFISNLLLETHAAFYGRALLLLHANSAEFNSCLFNFAAVANRHA